MKVKTDDLDYEIISLLQKDGRRPYKEIANDLGVSIGTIHNRISKLKKMEIINGFTVNINNEKLGYNLCFIILLRIDGKYSAEVLEELKDRKEILSCFHITGEQSATLICRFENLEDVQNFIQDLNKEKHILRTVSNMVLREYKNSSDVLL